MELVNDKVFSPQEFWMDVFQEYIAFVCGAYIFSYTCPPAHSNVTRITKL
jgi:hypothetical protein